MQGQCYYFVNKTKWVIYQQQKQITQTNEGEILTLKKKKIFIDFIIIPNVTILNAIIIAQPYAKTFSSYNYGASGWFLYNTIIVADEAVRKRSLSLQWQFMVSNCPTFHLCLLMTVMAETRRPF